PQNKQKVLEAYQNELYIPVVNLMEDAVRKKELAEGEPTILAQLFLGMVNAFVARYPIYKHSPEETACMLVNYFLKAAK
ncbi:MAG: hypothetical protein ACPL6F_04400, partial [Anaerolineales bacterium]